jgi:hypothetical protein
MKSKMEAGDNRRSDCSAYLLIAGASRFRFAALLPLNSRVKLTAGQWQKNIKLGALLKTQNVVILGRQQGI